MGRPLTKADLAKYSDDELRWLIIEKHKRDQERKFNQLADYWPQGKIVEFYRAGATFRERALLGGSQLGKTTGLCAEDVFHASGMYPDWWPGFRFDRPNEGVVVGETLLVNRNKLQVVFTGSGGNDAGEFGTGLIPKHLLGDCTPSGIPGGFEMIPVKHVSGGWSRILMRASEQGAKNLASLTSDWAHFDEEPPWPVFWEVRTRLQVARGPILCGFTPLIGMSTVVGRFWGDEALPSTYCLNFTIDDCELYTEERKAEIIAETPEHEREARLYGRPGLGSGLVFPIAWEKLSCEPFAIPDYYARIVGIDFGYEHPTAAVWMAIDRDSGRQFFTDEYRSQEKVPLVHAAAIRDRAAWMPVSWPADALQRNDQTGFQLRDLYQGHGLNMLPLFAQHEQTGIKGENKVAKTSVEAGLIRMLQSFQTGKLKVFSHLKGMQSELATYHRKNGQVVKLKEDLISAARYAEMMQRFAATPPPSEMETRIRSPLANADSWRL